MSKPKYRPGHFCQAEGCDNPLLWVKTTPYRLKKGWGRFCSLGCLSAWCKPRKKLKYRSGFFCQAERCNNPLLMTQTVSGRLKRGEGRFCSTKCSGIWATGENSSSWRGGTSFEPYPSTFNNVFKRKIRARDNHTCAICGAPDSKDVHHINYIKEDTKSENCITLCHSCHGKTGANRERWQAVLTEIVELTTQEYING